MTILGIETSCDETSAALVQHTPEQNHVTLLANIVSSSLILHKKTGGIIPEIAAREQLKYMLPTLTAVFAQGLGISSLNAKSPPIDAIAVTHGPGLIGSLLVGIETARTLSMLWEKPLIPVNHMVGHIYANFIGENSNLKPQISKIEFPAIALVVSGGHTDLLLLIGHHDLRLLGGTRDDAAGEAFDKIGRLLNLPYPGGPEIEKRAKLGKADTIRFPRPLLNSDDFDFSFSGLKSAAYREVVKHPVLTDELVNNLAASVQAAIIDVLVIKTLKAAVKYNAKSILLSGGVAANQGLKKRFELETENLKIPLFVPEKQLCTDNAGMIAASAAFTRESVSWRDLRVLPELYFT